MFMPETTNELTYDRNHRLRITIRDYYDAYYVNGEPKAADGMYSDLMAELRALEANYPDPVDDRLTTRLPDDSAVGEATECRHLTPMSLIDSVWSEQDVARWLKRSAGMLDGQRLVLEPKIDGVGISLVYQDGELQRAVLRGDGTVGIEVTEIVRYSDDVPSSLALQAAGLVEVRGAIFMTGKAFALLKTRRKKADRRRQSSSARNATADLLRASGPTSEHRLLSVSCFHLSFAETLRLSSHDQALDWIRQAGLPVNRDRKYARSFEQVVEAWEYWANRRGDIDHDIDGMVINVDDLELQRKLGEDERLLETRPGWCVTWKFPVSKAAATVKNMSRSAGSLDRLNSDTGTDVDIANGVAAVEAVAATNVDEDSDPVERPDETDSSVTLPEQSADGNHGLTVDVSVTDGDNGDDHLEVVVDRVREGRWRRIWGRIWHWLTG